ncbi:unnamed protein product [Closterium sp. Yama58-4]|nr:unnamed protein product [Closterium sp. Yama58-4]
MHELSHFNISRVAYSKTKPLNLSTSQPTVIILCILRRSLIWNNTTKHIVNSHDSSSKEITILMKNKGIDLRNDSFHVLQIEMERVVIMTPKSQGPQDEGLLEYLEKVMGTNKYNEQIKEKSQR